MDLLAEYREARRHETVARLRRVLTLRALAVTGMTQSQIAKAVGVTQPAVSQQLRAAGDLGDVHPELLLEAASPVLKIIAADRGYTRLAVFGSVARREARPESDIDLIVEAPAETSTFEFLRFKGVIEQVLGREIDLVEYGGPTPGLDRDIQREAVLL